MAILLILLLLCLTLGGLPSASAQEPWSADLGDATPVETEVDLQRTQWLVVTPPETAGLRAGTTATRRVETATGGRQVDRLPDGSIVVELDHTLTLEEMAGVADGLVEAGLAVAAEPDPVTTIARVPNDPLWQFQWGQIETAMPSAWDVTTGAGRAPVVGVLDTGVTATSEIAGRVLPGFNAQTGGADTADGNGHGTLSATLIAARGDNGAGFSGQCWDCRILPVKVLSDTGTGTMSQLASGLRWAVDNGAELVNISAGGADGSTVLRDAVLYARANGVTVVAAAGNDGDTTVLYPAAYPDVLSVAAAASGGVRYSWSTFGPQVDVAAPGCNVAQDNTEEFRLYYCGTSSATPFVSGLLALAYDDDPSLTPEQLRARAMDTAEPLSWVASGLVSAPGIVPGGAEFNPDGPGSGGGEPDPLPGVEPDELTAVTLTGTAGDLSTSLTWSATSGGSGSGYRYTLHRSTGADCDDTSPPIPDAATTFTDRSFTDAGLTHGRTYRYCVYASDDAGTTSERSNVVTVPAQDTSPPPPPPLRSAAAGDRSVDLQWSAVADPTGPITYRLHRTTASTCSASSPVVWTGTRTSTNDEGLTNGTRYRYCVTATDGAGNRSPASNARTAEPSRNLGTCAPLTGDWHASGRDGIGWWCDGQVRLRTADGEVIRYVYGRRGDVPIVADWNGDGFDTVSVIRDGTWFLNDRLAGGAASRSFIYGRVTLGDVPIAGAWTGGSRDLPGIVRDREWHLRFQQSGGNADRLFVYGRLTRGDLPLWGDWDASGRDTVGVVRDGRWLLRNELAGGPADLSYVYGRVLAGDAPVTGDWNGDARATPAIVRDGRWMLRYEHAGGNADETIVFRQP
ncbi:MAG: hypothetical protein EA387_00410 [Nitriliruptor sp.]|nr:MAG: hypothetical protein EA387_00410 [Nitriliruptor sp.]